jgi:hypothetical protein
MLCFSSIIFPKIFASSGGRIKALIIEWLFVGEHAMNRLQQFTHNGALHLN